MKIIRIVLLIVVAATTVGAGFGFLSERSLQDSTGFADSMSEALQDPAVKSELQTLVRATATEVLADLSDSGGVVGTIVSGLDPQSLADTAAKAIDSQAFATAWQQWALLLHQGLADYAQGIPNDDLTVQGNVIDVRAGPLITPLLGDGIARNLSGLVDSVAGDRTISLDTGEDVEERLHRLGALSDARWYFLVGALGALVIATLLKAPRLPWLAGGFAAAAIGFLTVAVWTLVDRLLAPPSPAPELTAAITDALTGNWGLIMIIAAIVCAGAAVVTGIISRRANRADSAEPPLPASPSQA